MRWLKSVLPIAISLDAVSIVSELSLVVRTVLRRLSCMVPKADSNWPISSLLVVVQLTRQVALCNGLRDTQCLT